jgi:aminopeptidase-like protein
MDDGRLAEVLNVMKEAIQALERNVTVTRTFDGLPCLSSPQYDLYLERFDPSVKKSLPEDSERWGHLLDSLLRYFDGNLSILDIAERHGLPFAPLRDYVQKFVDSGLAQVTRVELEPPRPFRVTT